VLEFMQVEHDSSRYRDLAELRRRILRIPLGLDFTARQLAEEKQDLHIAAYLDGELVGCVTLRAVDEHRVVAQLRQMAVDPDHQGRGVGAKIVAAAEELAAERGFRRIILHARETAIRFYEKAGYVATGETFIEVTIPHRVMVKQLAAADSAVEYGASVIDSGD
jgi:GNAT superfamily N-acetyltransferase